MRAVAVIPETTLAGREDVTRWVAALQTQVARDFAPTWGIGARLRVTEQPEADEEVLHLIDDARQAEELALHARKGIDRPCGFVLVRPCLEAGTAWETALSHQLLEMLADPLLHLAAEGVYQGIPTLFALEVCDPVDGDEYEIAGVPVANFVLPTWFVSGPLPDEHLVDFLGRLTEPFTLSPGGQATYCIELGRWQSWCARRCPRHRRQPGPFSRRRRRGTRLVTAAR